jgi:putative endonuclease
VPGRRVGGLKVKVENERPWFCYMLECSDGSLYVGSAKDPVARTKRHNWGVGSRHTALRRPVKLVWQEEHASEGLARGREAELKGWRREKKLELVAKFRSYVSPFALKSGSG